MIPGLPNLETEQEIRVWATENGYRPVIAVRQWQQGDTVDAIKEPTVQAVEEAEVIVIEDDEDHHLTTIPDEE